MAARDGSGGGASSATEAWQGKRGGGERALGVRTLLPRPSYLNGQSFEEEFGGTRPDRLSIESENKLGTSGAPRSRSSSPSSTLPSSRWWNSWSCSLGSLLEMVEQLACDDDVDVGLVAETHCGK